MELLYWFESIRTPMLDQFMSIITRLGEETVFMALAMFVFWCVDKRRGYYLLSIGFTGTLINQWLKIVCRVPRPWIQNPAFTIVESAREAASGYSFPSGHTQSAVGTFGGVARFTQSLWVRLFCIVLAVLTAVSRMYLGVHTPADVIVSLFIAIFLILILYPLIESTLWFPNRMYIIMGAMLVLSLVFIGFMEHYPFPADIDSHNFASAVKNAYTMAGAVAGMLLVYLFDTKLLKFSTRAPWWGQVIKLAGGLVLAVAVKMILKEPLLTIFDGHEIAHAVRYFILVLTAGCVWPLTFCVYRRFE
ncbi:MAG: phosphatase PAP2 family protein [Oscillospiraceae bacterium]|nr:phosphatase PAP2 family protein [Oscillospiraceae bacterium]